MNDKSIEDDPVGVLAESFVERYRRGERPSLTEYCEKHPGLAERIRRLFPTLVMMEELGPDDESLDGSIGRSRNRRGAVPEARLEQVGDYQILREIGRGGMGIVYEAEQQSLGRHVALKVLPIHVASDVKALERFRREARAAARLHHTNIVPVFGIGQDKHVYYYAMQFIQGQGLDQVLVELQRLRRERGNTTSTPADPNGTCANPSVAVSVAQALLVGEFDVAHSATAPPDSESVDPTAATNRPNSAPSERSQGAALSATSSSVVFSGQSDLSSVSQSNPQHFCRSVARVGVQVADALAYAHDRGVIHRDIKPSNLLLDTAGTVWVTDFGLAKTEGVDLTGTGDIVGTLRYMAPERFRGGSDPRSDVYGLGVTLYELLTLQPAFDSADRMRLIQQVMHAEPPHPRRADPRIPRDIETIVLKAIEKEPERRYASAADMAEDLRRFLADRPIQARRSAIWERTWRLCRRNPWLSGLSVAVAVLFLMVAVISLFAAVRLGAERNTTRDQLKLTQRAEATANHRLYRTTVNEAHAVRLSGQLGARAESLRLLDDANRMAHELDLPQEDFHELRNEVIASLALLDVRQAKQWPGYSVDTITVAFTANLDRYASAKRDGSISVRRVEDDAELLRIERTHKPDARMTLAFSPDGRFLAAFDYEQRLAAWDIDRNKLVVTDPACRFERAFDFSPDSTSIASGHDNEIVLYDLETGSVSQRWPTQIKPYAMAFHPDGDRLAVSATGRSWVVQIQEVGVGRVITELPATSPVFVLAWHPNRVWLAVSGESSSVTLWDVTTGKRYLVFDDTVGGLVAFSHSGTLIATESWGAFRLWNPHTGQQLFHMAMPAIDLRFSPDDRRIAATWETRNDMLGFLEIGTNDLYRVMGWDPQNPTAASLGAEFDATGQVLAIGYRSGFGLWDSSSGDELAFLPAGATNTLIREPSGSILSGMTGAFRWPVRRDQTAPDTLHVGPPERLPVTRPARMAIDRAGRVLATANFNGGDVRFMDRLEQPLQFGPHYDSRYVAVSPDGRWVATGSHWGTQVKIWEVGPDRVQHAKTLPIETASGVCFSPDGRWLAVGGHGTQLWHVPTAGESADAWRPGPGIKGSLAAFSPDGKTLALQTWYDTPSIRLVDFESRRELARLPDPYQQFGTVTFSPDATRVVAVGGPTKLARVWDLRRLREQLAERGLDWDSPPYLARSIADLPPIRRVTLDLGELASADDSKMPLKERVRHTIANYRRAFEANPADPLACNNLAWHLAIAPEPLREIDQAVILAEKAVAGTSDSRSKATYRNTLGVAYYRAGRFRDAIACLEQNLADQSDVDLPYDLYFLAMSHQQLGDAARARELLTWANRWVKSRADKDALSPEKIAEVAAFREEAEALIQAP